MKYISWILGVLLAIVVVTFSVNNLGTIAVDLWPIDIVAQWPIYIVILIAILFGFLYGAAVMWLSGHGARRDARRQRGEARRLTRELESFKRQPATPTEEAVPPARRLPSAAAD